MNNSKLKAEGVENDYLNLKYFQVFFLLFKHLLTSIQILFRPRARITINRLKELPATIESSYFDKGIEICLPQTKKAISLSGLPYGPDRKQLEGLLASLSTDKPALGIRFLNKNFYGVAKSGEVDKVLSLLGEYFFGIILITSFF